MVGLPPIISKQTAAAKIRGQNNPDVLEEKDLRDAGITESQISSEQFAKDPEGALAYLERPVTIVIDGKPFTVGTPKEPAPQEPRGAPAAKKPKKAKSGKKKPHEAAAPGAAKPPKPPEPQPIEAIAHFAAKALRDKQITAYHVDQAVRTARRKDWIYEGADGKERIHGEYLDDFLELIFSTPDRDGYTVSDEAADAIFSKNQDGELDEKDSLTLDELAQYMVEFYVGVTSRRLNPRELLESTDIVINRKPDAAAAFAEGVKRNKENGLFDKHKYPDNAAMFDRAKHEAEEMEKMLRRRFGMNIKVDKFDVLAEMMIGEFEGKLSEDQLELFHKVDLIKHWAEFSGILEKALRGQDVNLDYHLKRLSDPDTKPKKADKAGNPLGLAAPDQGV